MQWRCILLVTTLIRSRQSIRTFISQLSSSHAVERENGMDAIARLRRTRLKREKGEKQATKQVKVRVAQSLAMRRRHCFVERKLGFEQVKFW